VISATTATILGAGYAYIADFTSAVDAFEKAKALSLAGGNQFNAMVASSALAQIAVVHGHLRHAHQIYQDGLRLAGKSAFMAPGYTYAGLANVLCEWNELDAALEYAAQSVELCKLIGQAEILMTAYTSLARVRLARREFEAALATLEEARRVASEISAWSLDTILILQARVWLAKGDLDPAIRWAQNSGYSVEEPASFHREQGLLTLARLRMAQGQPEQVLPLLERLRQEAERSGRTGSLIEICILQALNFQARAETKKAEATLEKALKLAEPEGYLRIFVDEGEAMRSLLADCRKQALEPNPYLDKLLKSFPGEQATPKSALIEPLSERELEVLRLMAAGLSNHEIADKLIISTGTVKSHVHSVLGKLDARDRTQAVLKAQELKLV
jgi:LuxR family maltose regulon positive regulatory protein